MASSASAPPAAAAAGAPPLDLEAVLLAAVGAGAIADSWPWSGAHAPPLEHAALVGAMKSLEAEGYVLARPISVESWQLTAEAEGYLRDGSPEAQLFARVLAGGADADEAIARGFSERGSARGVQDLVVVGSDLDSRQTVCSIRDPIGPRRRSWKRCVTRTLEAFEETRGRTRGERWRWR